MMQSVSDRESRVESASVDTEHPWPGLSPYTEELQQFFHGRSEEEDELFRRVRGQMHTELVGESGLGKSSLLQAGLFPRLRREGFLPVRIQMVYGLEAPAPASQIKAAISYAIAGADLKQGTAPTADETLWEYFHRLDFGLRGQQGQPVTLVLAFDQFEELFTLGQADAARARADQFVDELATLINNDAPDSVKQRLEEDSDEVEQFVFHRQDYRLLFCLREDYVTQLEALRDRLRSVGIDRRMYLRRMNGEQALEAVVKPAGSLVSLAVARQIVRFVAGRRREESGPGRAADPDLKKVEIEPFLLSLVCRELNDRRIAQGLPQITSALLAGSSERILHDFYARCLADQPPAVRAFVEDELLTDAGFRTDIALEKAQKILEKSGTSGSAVKVLIDRRLLHRQERLNVQRVELTHDVLAPVVRKNRDERRQQEAIAKAEREKQEAIQHAEKEKAEAGRQAAERERHNRRRQRLLAAGLIAVLGLAGIFFVLLQHERELVRKADDAAHNADDAKHKADVALETANSERHNAFVAKDEAIKAKDAAVEAGKREALAREKVDQAFQELERATYGPRILQASRHWQSGNATRADELLSDSPLSLRRWEWHFLKSLSHSELFALRGKARLIWNVRYSPDGRLLATANDDGSVDIWNAVTYQWIRTLSDKGELPGHDKNVNDIAFSPDSQWLATASADKTLKIWEVSTGELKQDLAGHAESVVGIAFSPDGKQLASISNDRTVKLWDLFDRTQTTFSLGDVGLFGSVAFSPNGIILAAGSKNGRIFLWDLGSGEALPSIGAHDGAVTGLAFTPDGKNLVSCSYDGTVRIGETSNWSRVRTLSGHASYISRLAISPSGGRIATASWDETAKVWDLNSGEELQTIRGNMGLVTGVAFSPDGGRIAVSSGEPNAGEVKIWNAAGQQDGRALLLGKNVPQVVFSRDGKHLATAGDRVAVWDARTGAEEFTLVNDGKWYASVAFNPDGKLFAAGSSDNLVRLWDLSSHNAPRPPFAGHTGAVTNVAFHPKGQYLASASDDKTIRIWDLKSGETVITLGKHKSPVTKLAFSPSGKWLASSSSDRTVVIWDTATWKEQFSRSHKELASIAFISDDLIASGTGTLGRSGEVYFWDPRTGLDYVPRGKKEPVVLRGHASLVTSIAVSQDRLITGSMDNTIRIWDWRNGEELLSLPRANSFVTSVALSADGTRLASSLTRDGVRIWDALSQERFALRGHTDLIRCVTWHGDRLASAGNGEVKLWDASTGKPVRLPSMKIGTRIDGVAFSPDGSRIAAGGSVYDKEKKHWFGQVKIWEVATGKLVLEFSGHMDKIRWIAYSPDGQFLSTSSNDKTAKIWDATTGELRHSLDGHTAYLNDLAYSPDGRRLATSSGDKTVKIWDTASGELIATLQANDSVADVKYSADGNWIASTDRELSPQSGASLVGFSSALGGEGVYLMSVALLANRADGAHVAVVWNAHTFEKVRTFRGHIGQLQDLAFQPNGTQLAAASDDGIIMGWDIPTGRQVLLLHGHIGSINDVVYSPDGQFLATGGDDTVVRVWESKPNPEAIFAWHWQMAGDFKFAKEWGRALAHTNQLFEIEPENGLLYYSRGNIAFAEALAETPLSDQANAKFQMAIADYNRAIAIWPRSAMPYLLRGESNRQQGPTHYAEAEKDFAKAIELDPLNEAAYYRRAFISYQRGDWKATIADLTKSIEADSSNAQRYFERALCHKNLKDWNNAIQDFSEFIKRTPDNPRGYYERGRCWRELKKFEAAVKDFSEVIKRRPRDDDAYFWRARSLYDLGEWKLAIADFTKDVDLDPKDAEGYFLRGRCHLRLREFDRAITDFSISIKLRPAYTEAFYWRVQAQWEKGQSREEIEDALKDLKVDPKVPDSYIWRGRCRLTIKDFDAAITDFTEAINVRPRDDGAYYWRARAQFGKGQWMAAIADYSKVLVINAKDLDAFIGRGQCWLRMEEFEKAVVDFSEAIQLQPRNDIAIYWRAFTRFKQGKWKEAIDDYTKELEIDPRHAEGYFERGVCRRNLKEWDYAFDDFTQAISKRPNYAEAFFERGRCSLEKKNLDNAIKDFSAALVFRKDPLWQYWRGRTYYETGDLARALKDLDDCIKDDSKNAEAYLYRGLTLYRQGKQAEAKADFEKCVKLDPTLKQRVEEEKAKADKKK